MQQDACLCAGLELLDALEEGALMRVRREHMGRSSTGMGKNAQVRCVAEGFQARLLFEGQVCALFQTLLMESVWEAEQEHTYLQVQAFLQHLCSH